LGLKTIRDIPLPKACRRVVYPKSSFSRWITRLPLKKNKTIFSYRGRIIQRSFYRVWAVADLSLLFKSDLEQCADFCMRIWGDYHKKNGLLEILFLYAYGGQKRFFRASRKSYYGFLRKRMAYSNSWSIKKGGLPVADRDIRPGDMFVQNRTGGIGHVTMVLDACVDTSGRKYYLLGYSFMPAQEFHIERARKQYGKFGWFSLKGAYSYLNDYFNYGKPVLRRFK